MTNNQTDKTILNKRIQVYLSDDAKAALIRLMGTGGSPSETINRIIIESDKIQQANKGKD